MSRQLGFAAALVLAGVALGFALGLNFHFTVWRTAHALERAVATVALLGGACALVMVGVVAITTPERNTDD